LIITDGNPDDFLKTKNIIVDCS